MLEMQEYAKDFQAKNWKKGLVTSVTPYSFTFTEHEDLKNPNKVPKTVVYYLSYFLKLGSVAQ